MIKKYNILYIIVICLAVLSMTGCSNLNNKQVAINPDELVFREKFEDSLSDLMLDYANIERKDAAELEAMFDHVRERFEKGGHLDNRLKYILLLTLSDQEFFDRDKALDLLKEWPETGQLPQSINSFRKILIMRLEEESRLKKSVNQLYQQLENEKVKSKMLQKKVDDIKDMEKSLIRRNLP